LEQAASSASISGAANRSCSLPSRPFRQERGPTRTALVPGSPPIRNSRQLAPLRAKAAPEIEALLAACSQIECAGGNDVATIRSGVQKVTAMRTDVDAALRLPLAERRPGIAKEWNDVSTALVDELERVSQALTDNIRMVDPTIAELMAIKEASYVVRDAAGLERNQIQLAMAAKAVTPELKAAMAGLRGKVDAGWHLLRNLANRKGVPEPILAAVKAANEGYFGTFVKLRTGIEKALADGAAAPLSDAEFVNASNTTLDVLVTIPNAALDEAVAYAEARSVEARTNVLLQCALLLISLALAAVGFLVARRALRGRSSGSRRR